MTIYPYKDNILDKYFDSIRRLPLLTPDEEKMYARMWQNDNNEEGLRRLVEGNLRFVVKEAQKFQGLGLDLIDLISEGNLGLIEAAKRFDPERNNKFLTYASLCIKQSIFHALAENGSKVRLPEKLATQLYQLGKTIQRLEQNLERRPTSQEIADYSNLTLAKVEKLLIIQQTLTPISTDQPVGGTDVSVGDTLEQDVAPDAMETLEQEAFLSKLKFGLAMLSEEERLIIELHYGLNGNQPMPFEKIAHILSPPTSRENVRQMESRAFSKIRKHDSGMLSHFLGGDVK